MNSHHNEIRKKTVLIRTKYFQEKNKSDRFFRKDSGAGSINEQLSTEKTADVAERCNETAKIAANKNTSVYSENENVKKFSINEQLTNSSADDDSLSRNDDNMSLFSLSNNSKYAILTRITTQHH